MAWPLEGYLRPYGTLNSCFTIINNDVLHMDEQIEKLTEI